jgi:steroid delta-isomerase-like uncharacterized protein
MTVQLIQRYYAAFNRADYEGMLALLTDDVAHDVNQGAREVGVEAFRTFLERMERCYQEQVTELVVFEGNAPGHYAAEFVILGTYQSTDAGFIEARGQKYTLPVGAFFNVRDGKISRVTNHYNLEDWLKQVKS